MNTILQLAVEVVHIIIKLLYIIYIYIYIYIYIMPSAQKQSALSAFSGQVVSESIVKCRWPLLPGNFIKFIN